jgi:hypothetical protein
MPGKRMMTLGVLLIAAIALAGGAARAVTLPSTPDPSTCTAAPVTIERLTMLAAEGTPAASLATPVNAPAPSLDELTATVAGSIACTNANQPLRALAYFTDAYLAARFSGAGADDLGHLTVAVTRNPNVAAPADRLALISISSPTPFGDGRWSAIVTTRNASQTFVDRLVFAFVDGNWLIDAWSPAGPESATPAARG